MLFYEVAFAIYLKEKYKLSTGVIGLAFTVEPLFYAISSPFVGIITRHI